ncbi:MAG: DUF1080 domain-containing protein [Planctomycetia bacterium]|nr:DUF1080 domain-containing protein [Planctomycetia bacterium]
MFRLFLSVMFAACATFATAQDKKPEPKKLPRIAINDPAKLKDDADFATQGEYEGEIEVGGNKLKIGAQVIAKGDGKFVVKPFRDGLPGTSETSEARPLGSAERDGTKVVVKDNKGMDSGTIADGVLTITAGGLEAKLKKVERKSPTLGAKPPSGATVLFADEADVANWENGKIATLSDGKFLMASNPRSKKTFQSFTAHIEFRLAWMPNSTGQGRSNSGVYIQDRYELQVLDSFGLTGENNECGGFYQQSKPKVNMCLPPMQWQTYDIEYTAAQFEGGKKTKNAKVVVKHNGVLIQDYEFPKATPGGKFKDEVPDAGGLFFQDHGDPVVYRNVWVLEKK